MIPKVVKVNSLIKLLLKSLNASIRRKAQRLQQVYCILLKPKYFFCSYSGCVIQNDRKLLTVEHANKNKTFCKTLFE